MHANDSFSILPSIGAVRKYITTDCYEKLMHSFVTSKLHYCNYLLVNLPKSDIAKLQNSAKLLLLAL